MATEIRADNVWGGGRWRKAERPSEVGQKVLESGLTPEDALKNPTCLICHEPAVATTIVNSWGGDGEQRILKIYICQAHWGQWWFIPDALQHAWDASTQRSMN